MPCIHIPTWRAEDAHPSLLLGMIAIGLVYQSRQQLSKIMYRAARLSIIRYVTIPQPLNISLHSEAHFPADGVIHDSIPGPPGLDNAVVIFGNGLRDLEWESWLLSRCFGFSIPPCSGRSSAHDVSTYLTSFQIARSLIGPTADETSKLGHQGLSWENWVRLETLKR